MAPPKYQSVVEEEVSSYTTIKTSHKLILGGLLLALICLFEMHYDDILVESYNIINQQMSKRTKYGYLRPTPPYQPVIHTSHTCNITSKTNNNETILQEVVHLPVATPHLILIGAQKSGSSSFQSTIDKRINVVTPLSGKYAFVLFCLWMYALNIRSLGVLIR